jgi:hypothetical protein
MNVIVVAKRAGYSRSSYYNHIMDPELSFEILQQYGKALKYDFTANFPDMTKHILEEEESEYSNPTTLEQALKLADHWKHKYYKLLEKYQQLLEEKLKK